MRRAPAATPRMRPEVRPKKLTRRSASPNGKVFRMMASVSRAGMQCGRAGGRKRDGSFPRIRRTPGELHFLSQARGHRNVQQKKVGISFGKSRGLPAEISGVTWVDYLFGLLLYFLDGVDLPPVGADLGVVTGDAFHGDGLANLRHVAGNLGNAFGDDAACAIHALDLGVFTNANVRVAVGAFGHLGDETADRSVRGHLVGPAVGVFRDQLADS